MKIFVVPVPIFNSDLKVYSYKFMSKDADNLIIGEQTHTGLDGAVNPKLLETISTIGLDTLTMGKPLFVSFNAISILGDFQKSLNIDPSKIIITLDETVTPEEVYVKRVNQIKEKGYKVAVELPVNVSNHIPLIKICDYILVSRFMANHEANRIIRNYPEKRFVASNVDTYSLFDIAKGTGYNRFEGLFYRTPVTVGKDSKNISPMKIVTIELLNIVQNDDFELEDIAHLVEKDVALSVSMLKHINAQNAGGKIKTIQHATAMLGQTQIKKWVSTAAATSLGSDKSTEINRASLIRAKFCENLSPFFKQESNKESLFLMGLFSLLDTMLDLTMEFALDAVGVSDLIKDALVHGKGVFYPVYRFLQLYEAADWTNVSRYLIIHNIQPEDVYHSYIGALKWYRDLSEGLNNNI